MNYFTLIKQNQGRIPKGAKGWYASEMETWSPEKMKQVLKEYGKEGLTTSAYNWLTARVGASTSSTPSKPK